MAFKTLFSSTSTISNSTEQKSARRAARDQHASLVRELAAYRTPAERTEIELAVGRSNHPDAALVRNILDQPTFSGGRATAGQTA